MRSAITRPGEVFELRADEIDWFPTKVGEDTYHVTMSDEDLIKSPEAKRNLRREKRREKQRKKWE